MRYIVTSSEIVVRTFFLSIVALFLLSGCSKTEPLPKMPKEAARLIVALSCAVKDDPGIEHEATKEFVAKLDEFAREGDETRNQIWEELEREVGHTHMVRYRAPPQGGFVFLAR